MKTLYLYLLALLSGLLLTFAWFPHGCTPLIFISFVPLFILEKNITETPEKHHRATLFLSGYLAFLTWNVLTTWWVKNASVGGAALAILCNSLLMTLVFWFYHRVKKKTGEKWAYLILCSFWITGEFLHLDWDLSWPWLTLGNIFANTPDWIQWYEYTGVFGGGLWILITNCTVASCFLKTTSAYRFQLNKLKIIALTILLIMPVALSYLIKARAQAGLAGSTKVYDVVAVQPNIDPYNEKFSGSVDEQVKKMLTLAAEKIDSNTAYVLFPETALPELIWENKWDENESIQQLRTFIKKYPKLNIIIGAVTAKFYSPQEKRSATARKFTNEDAYYDDYNTALQLSHRETIQVYHKSKLVPGVEKLPFPSIFKFLDKLAIDLGGTTGSLGTQEERSVFSAFGLNAAPVICYESIYGEYVGDYVNNGANFIAIITNDGWWGDTPGYKQHLKYGALRAIETRRWIARSANTGISCFIDPTGKILQETGWWVPAAIKGKIQMRNEITFYTRYGDYIARIAMLLSALLIIYSLLIRFRIIKK